MLAGNREEGGNRYADELASNGLALLVGAFRNPILDYTRFYRSIPREEAFE